MRGTKESRDERRVARWQRDVGPLWLSDAAYELLVARLSIRHRALLWSVPIFVLAGASVELTFDAIGDVHAGTAQWARHHAYGFVALPVLLSIATMACQELTYRLERQLAASLTIRVSRTASVGLATVLGPFRLVSMAIVATLELVVGIACVWVQAWLSVLYLGLLAAGIAFVVIGLRRAVRRPTIAVDAESLAVDERLRSGDAFAAGGALFALLFAVPVSAALSESTPRWFLVVWFGSMVTIIGMQAFARAHAPWTARGDWRSRIPVAVLRQR